MSCETSEALFASPKQSARKQLRDTRRQFEDDSLTEVLAETQTSDPEQDLLNAAAQENGFSNHAEFLMAAASKRAAYAAHRIAYKREAEAQGLVIAHKHDDAPKAVDML